MSAEFNENYLIPSWETLVKNKEQYRFGIKKTLTAIAQKMGMSLPEIMIRSLMMQDLGLQGWRTPRQASAGEAPWIDIEVPPNTVISIYKFTQLSLNPQVSSIRVEADYGSLVQVEMSGLYGLIPILTKLSEIEVGKKIELMFGGLDKMVMEGYLSSPLFFKGIQRLKISVTYPYGSYLSDEIVIGGFVGERL